jgi:site-specific DNA-methyltransferase (adenine-specific)
MNIINTLFLGDCLEIMKSIEANSIDLLLTDLPYGLTKCKWDTPIDLNEMWIELHRICKNNAAMIFTAMQPFTSILVNSNIKNFKYEWIWEKPQGTNPLNAKIMPLKNHENILVFYRKKPKYNPIMTQGTPYSGFETKNNKTIGEVYGKQKSKHRDNKEGTRYPKTIQKFKQDRAGLHPTQKPVELCEYFIKTYSNENDLVLDICMGSGTTCVAAINTNRNYCGIEIDEEIFNKAKKRIYGILF